MNKTVHLCILFFSFLIPVVGSTDDSLKDQFILETSYWPELMINDSSLHTVSLPGVFQQEYELAKDMMTFSEEPLIPKIIHQIWVGPNPIPEKLKTFMESWKLQHPDWDYKLWTDEDLEYFDLYNQKAYDLTTNYGIKSDILRIEILYQYGGVYMDVDQLCYKSHNIFHHITELYCGMLYKTIANGVIGACKGHPALLIYMQKLNKKVELNLTNEKILSYTGPYFWDSCVREFNNKKNDSHLLVLPKEFFFPLPCKKRNPNFLPPLEKIKNYIKPYTYGIQYHTCTWMK